MERGTATADILPDCLVQNILSYLEEATKMSILSKTWLQAWLTHPNLEFRAHDYSKMKQVDKIMERYRDRKIPIDKFQFSKRFLVSSSIYASVEVFPLIDKWLDIALQNGVKHLVYTDTSSSIIYLFPIFKILDAKSLRELVVTDCELMTVSPSSGVANCNSLRKLSLSEVFLNDNMLQTLLTSCPLIESFILQHCFGLEKFELPNLQKIRSISIWTHGKQHVKIQAPTLERLLYRGLIVEPRMLDIVECQNLKSLELSGVCISDGFLQHLFCTSQSLHSLSITGEIDASDLIPLKYMGDQNTKLKIANDSSQLKHSYIHLDCWSGNYASWFFKLRKFLSNSISWSQVSLCFHNEIDRKYMHLHHVDVGVPPQVDVLNVDIKSDRGFPTFVDALLWSCHPRKLILASSIEMITCFMDRFMLMKNLSHSTSHGSKPSHNQIKKIKVFDEKNQPLELRSGKLAIRNLMEREKVYFFIRLVMQLVYLYFRLNALIVTISIRIDSRNY